MAMDQFGEARQYLEEALSIRERIFTPENLDVAQSLNNLAVLRYHEGKLSESADYMRRALAAREKSLGLNHPDTIQSRNNLAAIEAAMRRS